MAEENFECPDCDRSFDSERGLNSHRGQVHTGDEHDEETRENGFLPSSETLALTMNQALALAFFFGLAVGGFGTSLAYSSGSLGALTAADSGDQTNSKLVELQNTEYPYEGIEAGTGDSVVQMGNITEDLKDEPYLGSPDAGVKMVSYEEFECPFCKRFHDGAFQSIVENHIRTGEVQYYAKNFPLTNIHPWAVKAGAASECALNQDAEVFWTFHRGFFDNQDALTDLYKSNQTLFDRSMVRWAEQTGLDTGEFEQCYTNDEEVSEVRSDFQEGADNDVSGTPTLFVGSQRIVGAQPYSRFQNAIESELAE